MSSPDVSFDISTDELRRLAEQLVELMIEAVQAERADPVMAPISGPESRALFDEPLPREGSSPDAILATWRERVLPYCRRNGHPRFFAYVCTSADPIGILADGMASALNQPVTAWRSTPAAAEVERQVIRWLDELVGFGASEGGLLVSGGSTANFHGFACAVSRAERERRVEPGRRDRMTIYLSSEGHVSMRKAARLLGIPADNVRSLPVDGARRMIVGELQAAIEADRARGLIPVAIGASAGTANTGAIDPLVEIAELCSTEDLWFHIDGAYGAPAVLTAPYAWMSAAFERADSMSLDPHKWLFATADAGCVLVRDADVARSTFAFQSEYTEVSQTDAIERYAFFDHGLEMSRRFRGLKVWSILKARGVRGVRAAIAHDIALREHLDARVEAEPLLEALGSELSIASFRYRPAGETCEATISRRNREIATALVAGGRFYLSPTRLDGHDALRVCIVNFRTRREDIDALVDEIQRLGALEEAPRASGCGACS